LDDEQPGDGPEAAEGPASPGLGAPVAPAGGLALGDAPAAEPESSLAGALEPAPADGAAQAYEQRARLAEDRLGEVLAAYRKLKTDNDRFRERTAKNVERRYDQRRERLLLKFIDILDNLDRALEAAESTQAAEPLIDGLILVRTQLLQTLQDEGLERIPALGQPFDPAVSEAVQTQPVEEPEHHQLVIKELLRGYRLRGRIARASRVVVGVYTGADAAAVAPGAGEPVQAVEEVSVGGIPELPEDDLEELPESPDAEDLLDISPPPPPAPPAAAPQTDGELSLEEIVARAVARDGPPPATPSGGDEGDDEGGEG
jgi:molecular chaperone GrpE